MNQQLNRDLNRILHASEERIRTFMEQEAQRKEVEIELVLVKHNVPEPQE